MSDASKLLDYVEVNILKGVARQYARKFDAVEYDDIAQELRLWTWRNKAKVLRWFQEELDGFGADRLVARCLQNAAHDYCMAQVAPWQPTLAVDFTGRRRVRSNASALAALQREWE